MGEIPGEKSGDEPPLFLCELRAIERHAAVVPAKSLDDRPQLGAHVFSL